jgi:hypothetical protein
MYRQDGVKGEGLTAFTHDKVIQTYGNVSESDRICLLKW